MPGPISQFIDHHYRHFNAAALKDAGARAAFDALAFTHRKEHVRAIEDAKAPETRARRIAKAVQMVTAKSPRGRSR